MITEEATTQAISSHASTTLPVSASSPHLSVSALERKHTNELTTGTGLITICNTFTIIINYYTVGFRSPQLLIKTGFSSSQVEMMEVILLAGKHNKYALGMLYQNVFFAHRCQSVVLQYLITHQSYLSDLVNFWAIIKCTVMIQSRVLFI